MAKDRVLALVMGTCVVGYVTGCGDAGQAPCDNFIRVTVQLGNTPHDDLIIELDDYSAHPVNTDGEAPEDVEIPWEEYLATQGIGFPAGDPPVEEALIRVLDGITEAVLFEELRQPDYVEYQDGGEPTCLMATEHVVLTD